MGSFFGKNKNTFFGSDTNARHPDFGDYTMNYYGVSLQNLSATTNLKLFNSTSPTCYRAAGGSYIDKFMSNSHLCPVGCVKSIVNFSDHLAIACQLPLNLPNTDTYHTKLKLFNKIPMERANQYILRNLKREVLPLNQNISNENCENLAININNIFQKTIDKFVPTIKKEYRNLLSPEIRALQREARRIHRKIFALGRLCPTTVLRPLTTQLNLLKIMIKNGVRFDTARYFTNIYNSIDDNKRAFDVIRRYTGHKKRFATPASLFVDLEKTQAIAGSENIANSLANNFSKNHRLTKLNTVADSINVIDSNSSVIPFGNGISPNIVKNSQLSGVNDKLPINLRGLFEGQIHIFRHAGNTQSLYRSQAG